MGALTLHDLFLYCTMGIGGILAGIAMTTRQNPRWQRLLGGAFLFSDLCIIGFALLGH